MFCWCFLVVVRYGGGERLTKGWRNCFLFFIFKIVIKFSFIAPLFFIIKQRKNYNKKKLCASINNNSSKQYWRWDEHHKNQCGTKYDKYLCLMDNFCVFFFLYFNRYIETNKIKIKNYPKPMLNNKLILFLTQFSSSVIYFFFIIIFNLSCKVLLYLRYLLLFYWLII